MQKEELLDAISNKLDVVGATDRIVPENIRPVAIPTKDRQDLGDMEVKLQAALDSVKADDRLPGILYRLANVHLQEGSFARAIILYEMTLGLNSKLIPAWIHMGLAYRMIFEPRDAVSCLGSALAMDPRNITALTHLGWAQMELEDYKTAGGTLDAALILSSKNARALLGKGKIAKITGSFVNAITWFNKAIDADPNFLPAYMELGNLYIENKEWSQAKEILDKALWINSEQPYVLGSMGDVYHSQGEYESALFYYDKAVGIKFDDPSLWIRKGDSHKALKGFKQASHAYHNAINANPELTEGWIKSGQIMLLMNDESAALEYFNTALALAPDYADVAHQRGLVYFSLEKYEEALTDFDMAFSVDAGNPEHLYYRAIVLENLDRKAEALRTWQVAQVLYEEAENGIKVAESKARAKRLEQALK
ncbi:MAG: tetratricopeptide repeat protein [Candidatus Thorarchaeota archaeon]|jgi:tetratricopeptide (TPR) repeat protein